MKYSAYFTWNPADFMKSGGFHPWKASTEYKGKLCYIKFEIHQISPEIFVKSAGFHSRKVSQSAWVGYVI